MPELVPAKTKSASISTLLESRKSEIAKALPRHLTADRMLRVAMTSIARTPKLLDCTPTSLVGCVMQCAQLGLEPDGVLGHAYLLPYGDTCTLIVGYKGLIDLARRSGQIATIQARVVYEQDEFRFAFGLAPMLHHVPVWNRPTGPIVGAYAVATLKDGSTQWDVMSLDEIEAIQRRSRAGKAGPWVTDFPEMAKKTVLRRLCKLLPMSVEAQKAVALAERAELGVSQEIDVLPLPEANGKPPEAGVQETAPEPAKPEIAAPRPAGTASPNLGKGPVTRAITARCADQGLDLQAVQKLHEKRMGKEWGSMTAADLAILRENLDSGEVKRALSPQAENTINERSTAGDEPQETMPPADWDETQWKKLRQKIALRLAELGVAEETSRHSFLLAKYGFPDGLKSVPPEELPGLLDWFQKEQGTSEAKEWATGH